jgi:uncharacterized protein
MINEEEKNKFIKMGFVFIVIVSIYFVAKIGTEFKNYKTIGMDHEAKNTITVSGDGESFAIPDIAEVSFTVRSSEKTMNDSQQKVNEVNKKVLDYVKSVGIEDKDIKTQNYNSYPKYEWQKQTIYCVTTPCPQPEGKQVLVGYEVSQTITIKIRKTEQVSTIVDELGKLGVTEISGPNFTVDNLEKYQEEARKEAIDKAKEKADILAKDLGVKLVRIVSFSDGNSNAVMPMAYGQALRMEKTMDASVGASLPQGEQKIVSNVSITYEIR